MRKSRCASSGEPRSVASRATPRASADLEGRREVHDAIPGAVELAALEKAAVDDEDEIVRCALRRCVDGRVGREVDDRRAVPAIAMTAEWFEQLASQRADVVRILVVAVGGLPALPVPNRTGMVEPVHRDVEARTTASPYRRGKLRRERGLAHAGDAVDGDPRRTIETQAHELARDRFDHASALRRHAGNTLTSVALTAVQTGVPSTSWSSCSAAGVISAISGTAPSTRTRMRSPSSSMLATFPAVTFRGLPVGSWRCNEIERG